MMTAVSGVRRDSMPSERAVDDTERLDEFPEGVVDLADDTDNIGGKEPDGKPAAIGRWTFQTKKVRDTLLPYLKGDVLNAFAGQTRLADYKRGVNEVRNDLNPDQEADYHVDAADLGEIFDEDSFDVVVLDPPFDQTQSDEHYDGLHARDMGAVRRTVAPLVKPGGRIVEFGWNLWDASDYYSLWSREEKLLFRRAIPERQPVLMTVCRKAQTTLVQTDDGRNALSLKPDTDQ
jgi:hypothetical protein